MSSRPSRGESSKSTAGGAVVVPDLRDPSSEAAYIPLEMLANPVTEQAAQMATAYDPRKEIVVILMSGSGVTGYRGAPAGRVAPSDAYRRLDDILFGKG